MKFGRAIGVFAACITLTFRTARGKPLQLLRNIGEDQKQIWSFPVAAASGHRWKPALGVIGATATLIALDPTVTTIFMRPGFQGNTTVRTANRILSAGNMALLINAVPLLASACGLVQSGSYASRTGQLAGESAANAEIVAMVMKHIDRRMRPVEAAPTGDFRRTWFRTRNRNVDGSGCFPSGHTASAFAVATVFAERYSRHRWASFTAFGLAGIVGASRLTNRAHFLSDVFFGAVLGYSISHFVVVPRGMKAAG